DRGSRSIGRQRWTGDEAWLADRSELLALAVEPRELRRDECSDLIRENTVVRHGVSARRAGRTADEHLLCDWNRVPTELEPVRVETVRPERRAADEQSVSVCVLRRRSAADQQLPLE